MYVEFGLLANVFDTYVYFLGQFLGWLHKKRDIGYHSKDNP